MGTTTIFNKLLMKKQLLSKDYKTKHVINSLPWESPGTKYQASHFIKLSDKLSYVKICFTLYQFSDYLLDIQNVQILKNIFIPTVFNPINA